MKFKLLVFIPLLFTLFLYVPSLSFDFAWLDFTEILGGQLIIDDWIKIFFIDDANASIYHRPLYNLIHTMDFRLWRQDPYGYHLSNVILHLANVTLLFFFLLRLEIKNIGVLPLTIIWAVLPVLVPVVALIHAKGDLLYTFFFLIGAILFLKQEKKWNILVLLFLLLSLLSKETAVGGILFLLIHGRLKGRDWKSLWPIISAIFIFVVIKVITLTQSHGQGLGFDFHRLLTFPLVYGSYFFESLTGARLGISDTVFAWNGREILSLIKDLSFFIVAVGMQVFCWKKIPASRPFILIFNLFLLPVSQIIPSLHFRADRFLYFAAVGWIGIWATFLRHWIKKDLAMTVIWILAVGWFAFRSFEQIPYYKNNETLFERVLEVSPENREARAFMGQKMLEDQDYSAAIFHLSRALNGNPKMYSYVNRKTTKANLGTAKLNIGQYDDCIKIYKNLAEKYGSPPEYDFNWSLCYKNSGQAQNAYDRMVRYQRKYPNDIAAMEKMAEIYIDLGKKSRAIDEFNKVLKMKPDHQYKEEINRAIIQLRQSR